MSWNNVKAVLLQHFSLVHMVTHVAAHLMHRYQQKRESLQQSNFQISKHIQVDINCEPKDITRSIEDQDVYLKLFHLAIGAMTIRYEHATLQKAINYAQKIEMEFLLVEGIQ